ncbi:hypothetical protein DFH09DRAFT_1099799 [Mycena vulgaris]|nr:hypothetical protein DFH09DRAFT_1099799 [Mycena vulgaris]
MQVNAEVTGDVNVAMDLAIGRSLNMNNAQLTFPAAGGSAPDPASFSFGDTPLMLSAVPSVQVTGTLTAHFIPQLDLHINAIGGKASTDIFLALDTSASLVTNLNAAGSPSDTIGAANSTAPSERAASWRRVTRSAGLFQGQAQVSLFSKSFQLFQLRTCHPTEPRRADVILEMLRRRRTRTEPARAAYTTHGALVPGSLFVPLRGTGGDY